MQHNLQWSPNDGVPVRHKADVAAIRLVVLPAEDGRRGQTEASEQSADRERLPLGDPRNASTASLSSSLQRR